MAIFDHPTYVLAILCLLILFAEWLVNHTALRHLSSALLVIVLGAIAANLGVIPSASDQFSLYGGIFTYLAPLSIFYLLLEVNLANLKQAGLPMLLMFVVGSLGTVLGVLLGMGAISGSEVFGERYAALGGMFTGTYTGGSVNFNAIALHYDVMTDGVLYAGSVAVDNILTALWMVASILLPRLLQAWLPRKSYSASTETAVVTQSEEASIKPAGLALLVGLGVAVIWISDILTEGLGSLGINIPSILILTTIALILAQIPNISKLAGTRMLGMFCIYLFLVVIGAYCELAAMSKMGEIAIYLMIFVLILALTHALTIYGIGALLKLDWSLISVASQANIGGSSTAIALAKSLERPNLMLPAILVGSFGNGLGTYLGFLVAEQLL
ncbi:MAG: DUF819 family protein [Bacteroidota bacterium]